MTTTCNPTHPAITIAHLSVEYNNQPVLLNLSCAIPSGKMVAIVGPNGAGKTTLMKSMLGLITPLSGSVQFLGEDRAAVAYIPQRASIDWDFPCTVLDVVLMGRYRKIGWFARPCTRDYEAARTALKAVSMLEYADRPIGKLSGGQQQRIFLARALVQEPSILLLDEPFVGVDVATEKLVTTFLHRLSRDGKTVVVVHHDLNTLAEYFDYVLLINVCGIAFGTVEDVLKPEFMCAAYGDRRLITNRATDIL